jgi:hypothetical protein
MMKPPFTAHQGHFSRVATLPQIGSGRGDKSGLEMAKL